MRNKGKKQLFKLSCSQQHYVSRRSPRRKFCYTNIYSNTKHPHKLPQTKPHSHTQLHSLSVQKQSHTVSYTTFGTQSVHQSALKAPSPQTESSNLLHNLLHTNRAHNQPQILLLLKQSNLRTYTISSSQTESIISYRWSISSNRVL